MGGSVPFAEDLRPRQHAIANDAALYFAGTFKNCREPCVAPVAFDPTLRGVAIAPMELRGLIRYPHCHFGREQLYLRGLAFRRLTLVLQMGNLLPEGSRLGNLGGHVGKCKAQSLKLSDGMAELFALLQICPRVLEGCTGNADGARRSVHASHVQAALHGGESPGIRVGPFVTVETCKAIIFRNAHPIEFEVPGSRGSQSCQLCARSCLRETSRAV
jgi:hypothetical protein